MNNYINQMQKMTLAVVFSLLSFCSVFGQAETAKIKDGTVSNGAAKAKDGAIFELESNNKGMLTSRLTTEQRNAIPAANLSNGLLVYNSSTNCFDYWDALRIQWLSLCGTPPPAVFDVQCSKIKVEGAYKQGDLLDGSTNKLIVPVTVTEAGTYTISATTTNGYYFSDSGTFPNVGTYTLILEGKGRPDNGYEAGLDGDTVTLALNGIMNACQLHIFVEKATVDFTMSCTNIVVEGPYNVGLNLDGNVSRLKVDVNVTTTGTWSIKTATVNGYFFAGTDEFTTTGPQTVYLLGSGTPTVSGVNNFTLFSNAFTKADQRCENVSVTVAPVAYTMNCGTAQQQGSYMENVALSESSNTITLPINVTATGPTTITTNTVNGVSFTTGPIVLTKLGADTVILRGSGKPLTGGTTALMLTGTPGATSTCPFNLSVAKQPIAYTMNCTGITVAGNYAPGLAMNGTNTMTIPVTVTYAGDWTASTEPVNGVSFSGSGTFTTTGGGQSMVLKATGTPQSGGPFTFPITANSTTGGSCTKEITFVYRTMNVLGIGYGIYNPTTAGVDQATRAILQSKANFGPTASPQSGVQVQEMKIYKDKFDPSGSSSKDAAEIATLKSIINSEKIDIIVLMYNIQPTAGFTAVLEDFVKNKKGVLIHGQEIDSEKNVGLITAICGGSPSVKYGGGKPAHINNIITSNDPVINGPFGNISGKLLGTDAGESSAFASNLPSNVTVLATKSDEPGAAYAFKHNTLGFLWVGDGGVFAGNTTNIKDGNIYPALISTTGQPLYKNYNEDGGRTVCNSFFYANTMAWAVKYAQENTNVSYVIP